MTGAKPDERIRTPMRWDPSGSAAGFTTGVPWEALSDDAPGTDVTTQREDSDSLWSTYRDLIALRNAEPALRSGTLVPVGTADDALVAYLRAAPDPSDGAVLVVANVADRPVPSFTLSLAEGPLCGVAEAETLRGPAIAAAPKVSASGGFDDYAPLTEGLGPRETLIVRLRR
jgi:glycosidase